MDWYTRQQEAESFDQNVLQVARSRGYTIGPLWHGGGFSVAAGDTTFNPWTHFGTLQSAEERVGGSGIVDNLLKEVEVDQDPETGEWYATVGNYDTDDTYDSEEEAREAGEQIAFEMAENAEPPDSVMTSVVIRPPCARIPDLGTWGLRDVIINTPSEYGLTPEERQEIYELVTSGRINDEWNRFAQILSSKGLTSFVYRNAIEHKGSDSYMVIDPTAVKLADPVTYDDAGNPIPLELRFDASNPDVRY